MMTRQHSARLQFGCHHARRGLYKGRSRPPAVRRCQASAESTRWTRAASTVSSFFPVWVVLGALLGCCKPAAYSWITRSAVTNSLAITMLAMGTTISTEVGGCYAYHRHTCCGQTAFSLQDILRLARNPRPVVLGATLQFTIMPLLGFCISRSMNLQPSIAAGYMHLHEKSTKRRHDCICAAGYAF